MKIQLAIKKIGFVLSLFFCLTTISFAQKVTYSTVINEDDKNVNFEILGNVNNNILIYKKVRWKHMIQVLDQDMKTLSNERLKFISEKTFNIDFVPMKSKVAMIYQYQRGNRVYCYGAQIDGNGKVIQEPILLDTSSIGFLGSNRMYNLSYSEDRSKILVYKIQKREAIYKILTKVYDEQFVLKDSVRNDFEANGSNDIISDFQIMNNGTIGFSWQTKRGIWDYIDNLILFSKSPQSKTFVQHPVKIENYLDETQLKVDNANNQFLFTSFYYKEKRGNIYGLAAARVKPELDSAKITYIDFADSIRNKFSNSGNVRTAFNDLLLKNIYIKRDGSFIAIAEDFSSLSYNNGNNYNRWNYLFGSPSMNDYYYYNRYNNPYYRSGAFYGSERYYYDNLLILGIDKNLKTEWQNILFKKQMDEGTDDFLSYGTMNAGNEIYILYDDSQKSNSSVISNQSITPFGTLNRYPTIKTMNTRYDFMPKLGKQIGLKQIVVPAMYRNRLVFAKIDFGVVV